MDPAIVSAASGLTGSLIGGLSTLAAALLAQRGQLRAQTFVHEAAKREALYSEFITEAARRLSEAWSHHAETPEVIAGLYSAVERMRLTSSSEVIQVAEEVLKLIVEAYAAPDRTFDELRERLRDGTDGDLLRNFAEACRIELRGLRA